MYSINPPSADSNIFLRLFTSPPPITSPFLLSIAAAASASSYAIAATYGILFLPRGGLLASLSVDSSRLLRVDCLGEAVESNRLISSLIFSFLRLIESTPNGEGMSR
ncbi:unnamed protein product [Linum trigynum]|uniref:Uncharacterized protein n=1 Tax=Linum trigynum TaxID=586398 RepID=A0AAV2EW34_9ROSI